MVEWSIDLLPAINYMELARLIIVILSVWEVVSYNMKLIVKKHLI